MTAPRLYLFFAVVFAACVWAAVGQSATSAESSEWTEKDLQRAHISELRDRLRHLAQLQKEMQQKQSLEPVEEEELETHTQENHDLTKFFATRTRSRSRPASKKKTKATITKKKTTTTTTKKKPTTTKKPIVKKPSKKPAKKSLKICYGCVYSYDAQHAPKFTPRLTKPK